MQNRNLPVANACALNGILASCASTWHTQQHVKTSIAPEPIKVAQANNPQPPEEKDTFQHTLLLTYTAILVKQSHGCLEREKRVNQEIKNKPFGNEEFSEASSPDDQLLKVTIGEGVSEQATAVGEWTGCSEVR